MPRGVKTNAELDLLTAVERGEVITQQALAKRIGIAVGLVNALVKRAVAQGFVRAREVPDKKYAYYLTPDGFVEKKRLVAEHLDASLGVFRQLRAQYVAILRRAQQMGASRIVLVGGGELAEIAVLAAATEEVALTAIVEPGANDSSRFGIAVFQRLQQVGLVDAAIITDARSPQDTYERVRVTLPRERVFAPPLLRVTPDRASLEAAAREREERT